MPSRTFQFIVAEDGAPLVIRCHASSRCQVPDASLHVSIACIFDPCQVDLDSASRGSASTHEGSHESGQSSKNFEQDLEGFDAADSASRWGRWWCQSEDKLRSSLTEGCLHDYEPAEQSQAKGQTRGPGCGAGGGFVRGRKVSLINEEPKEEDDEVPQATRSMGRRREATDARGGAADKSSAGSASAGAPKPGSMLARLMTAAAASSSGATKPGALRAGGSSSSAAAAAAREYGAVGELLFGLGLGQYARALVAGQGFDDLEVLRSLRPDEFKSLASRAGMLPGHAAKLRLLLGVARPPDQRAMDRAALLPPADLVGKWVEVEGMGQARVVGFERVWNKLLFDSCHVLDFTGATRFLSTANRLEISRQRRRAAPPSAASASTLASTLASTSASTSASSTSRAHGGGLRAVRLVLRRRKLGRWNKGAGFEILDAPVFV